MLHIDIYDIERRAKLASDDIRERLQTLEDSASLDEDHYHVDDYAFIAQAKQDVLALVAEVRRLRDDIETANEKMDGIREIFEL
jgi:hypothetical protein